VAASGAPPLRVGLVLEEPDVGRGSDPFQHGAYLGLVRAHRELGVEAKAVSPSPTGYDPYGAPLAYLARQKYDLVLALGFLEAQALGKVAMRFPSVKFALLDSPSDAVKGKPRNVEGTLYHTEQPAYLAGYLAARMADRGPPPHVISSVGGLPIPPVEAFIAGYQAGARKADPKITILNAYSYDFGNPVKCERIALDQITHGSRVVFDVAGSCGIGALTAARRKGVFGIGVDIDQSFLGPFVLTSVVKDLGVTVFNLSKLLVDGRLKTRGNLEFDLASGGVTLGAFSPRVPQSLRREVARLRAQIVSGAIDVPASLTK
jgi:basic membrane protein A and related proteins